MATFLGPRCVIATSTATIRVRVDHPTIANVSRDRARKIAAHHLRFFSKKPKAILRHQEGEGRFLSYWGKLGSECLA
jgi:hypothetical protein